MKKDYILHIITFLYILMLVGCTPCFQDKNGRQDEDASKVHLDNQETYEQASSSLSSKEEGDNSMPDTFNNTEEAENNKGDIDMNMEYFKTPLVGLDGKEMNEDVTFSMSVPNTWSMTGNTIYTDGDRIIAEILPSIPFTDSSVYDKLAEQYPNSDPVDVTVGGLTGKYFYCQTRVDDPVFEGRFHNEIFYYLEHEKELICIKFYPGYGVGIGTQRKEFQEAIEAIQ